MQSYKSPALLPCQFHFIKKSHHSCLKHKSSGPTIAGFIAHGSLFPPQTPPPVILQNNELPDGEYKITKVLDGDTVELENTTRLRYAGIDAPELHERYGTAAFEFNRDQVQGKIVRIEISEEKEDIYGRTLGYVFMGDKMLNEKMTEEGYATVLAYNKMKKPKYYERFVEAQDYAKSHHNGMWVKEFVE